MASTPHRSKALAALAVGLWCGCATPPGARVPPGDPPSAAATAIEQTGFAAERPSPVFPAAVLALPPRPPEAHPPASDLPGLQRLALENSPSLRQAAADVAAARGAAVQAGLYPNPTVGYQGDQIGSGHTAGQQGGFVSQTFVTQGKLGLAQAAALADVTRAEVALQQARSDLVAQVRARYHAVRTAVESVRVAEDLARTADALAERQRKLLESGQPVAPHEVDQARALAATARGEVIQARNRRTAASRQLATLVGSPELPMPEDVPGPQTVPPLAFDELRRRVLESHTELRAAAAEVERARFQLELARVTPSPNVETHTAVQYDYTTHTPQVGLQVGVALPVFDRNQGNIARAEAQFVRATHEAARVRQELTQRLAEAFERYQTGRQLLEQYRTEILPNQTRAFEGLRRRFEQEPGKVSFTEVVLGQQTLANTYAGYLNVLSAVWQAVAELGRLAQTEDLLPAAPAQP
jgi:cobalt-zinc-cadmium efflux system outer membrane protein